MECLLKESCAQPACVRATSIGKMTGHLLTHHFLISAGLTVAQSGISVSEGGINALCGFSQSYVPMNFQYDLTFGDWDIDPVFPSASNNVWTSFSWLTVPLFNDACDAYRALGKLIGHEAKSIHPLVDPIFLSAAG